MLEKIRKSVWIRGLSTYLVAFILTNGFMPISGRASSNGPAQVDFSPGSGGNMVDPFTGDFHYNIPLLEVPGPNGSYPISLSYSSSNISMETDAGWVGLGWNLNLGAISREMRGLPDDFKGDAVTKGYHMRDVNHWALTMGASSFITITKEVLGFDVTVGLGLNFQLYHNSYTGLGLGLGGEGTASMKLVDSNKKMLSSIVGGPGRSVNLSIDGQKGVSYSTTTSISSAFQKAAVGNTLNSRTGSHSVCSLSGGPLVLTSSSDKVKYVPGLSFPTRSSFGNHLAQIGFSSGSLPGDYQTFDAELLVSKQEVSQTTEQIGSYGYLYSENAGTGKVLMDYNNEHDIPTTEDIPAIPTPVFLCDNFHVSGPINGTFRAFRGDIGILHKEHRSSSSVGNVDFGVEAGLPGAGYKAGLDYGEMDSYNSSGTWLNNASELNTLDFKSPQTGTNTENVYFKFTDEITTSEQSLLNATGGYDPVKFDISMLNMKPYVANRIQNSSPYGISTSQLSSRQSRERNIEYFTVSEVKNNAVFGEANSNRVDYLWDAGENPLDNPGEGVQYAFPNYAEEHHIGMIRILDSDGSYATYGIPVYTTAHSDVTYSVNPTAVSEYTSQFMVGVNSTDPTDQNDQGRSALYYKSELPEYANAYLLTSLTSHDYVDLTGNGPSDDDLGFFVKFNYTKYYSDFQWRTPYKNSYFVKGNFYDLEDDMGSYSYGTKEVYYANSVETKTHIAVFELEDRLDGEEPDGEFNTADANGTHDMLKRLKSIKLYSKDEPSKVLREIKFCYDYSLCTGWLANSGTGSGNDGGKLTLKKVVIINLENDKGANSPYEFTYAVNPGYEAGKIDKWGTYAQVPVSASFDWNNTDNPIHMQGDYNKDGSVNASDNTDRNNNAAAWLLSTIVTPSNGEIDVTYESDDFGYVQNIRAKSLFQIVGTSKESDSSPESFGGDAKLSRKYLRVYFRLQYPISNGLSSGDKQAEVYKYIEGIDQVFFKAYVRLSHGGIWNTDIYDYIKCYGQIDKSSSSKYGVVDNGGSPHEVAYFTVKSESWGSGAFSTHPITKATWQNMRLDRPDLNANPNFSSSNSGWNWLGQILPAITSTLGAIPELIGYYNAANLKGWGERLKLTNDGPIYPRPSFARLNCIDRKTGGGARVSRIEFKDNWGDVETGNGATMGMTFEYVNEDGSSSGVATSEPHIYDEDNSLKTPEFYSADQNVVYHSDETFLERPYNESYFPDPQVGYSRVVIKNIMHGSNDIGINNTGVIVHKFYTARDFPVISRATTLKYDGYNDIQLTFLPFGYKGYQLNGYSQGFYCETNNMHGKIKETSNYRYTTEDYSDPPVSKTQYVYHTNSTVPSRLDNNVNTLVGDQQVVQQNLGETYEFFISLEEHYSKSSSLNHQVNIDFLSTTGFLFVPTYWKGETSDEVIYRAVATNKIVHKNGILQKVIHVNEGATSVAENLYYDPNSGNPLVTSRTNSFKNPVYEYDFNAYWSYDGMKAAYQNWGSNHTLTHAPSSGASYTDADQYFAVGDEVQVVSAGGNLGKVYYITDVTSGSLLLSDKDGNEPSFTETVKIIRSGYRNLLRTSNGKIISLQDPQGPRGGFSALMSYYNANIAGTTPSVPYLGTFNEYHSCFHNSTTLTVYLQALTSDVTTMSFTTPDGSNEPCEGAYILFEDAGGNNNNIPSLNMSYYHFDSYNSSTGEVVVTYIPTGAQYTGIWTDPNHCFDECFKVLHAHAIEFSDDDWTYNYFDLGDPEVATSVPLSTSSLNEYRYGKKGIWRTKRNNLYQIGRDRTAGGASYDYSRIDIDGEYSKFEVFDWNNIANNGSEWNWAQEITRYSAYGYALETKDRLGIYASKLFGYSNSVSVATAANSEYFETAFDGFEDYGGSYASHGHLDLKNGSNPATELTLLNTQAHTGTYACAVPNGGVKYSTTVDAANPDYFTPHQGVKYLVSAWFKITDVNDDPVIEINGGAITPDVVYSKYQRIEGWLKYEVAFTAPSSSSSLDIVWSISNSGSGYIDDIRIHPFDAAMTSSVFDPQTLWKVAELDNQNYATFFNYDENGQVIQMKKETENGIVTLSTGRSNINQNH